jgi:hypothetical protein
VTTTEPTPSTGRGRGRPAVGPRIGPFAAPTALHEKILAHQQRENLPAQADAVRDLLEVGTRGPWPVPEQMRARIEAFQAAETFDSYAEAVVFLIEDALNAAGY